MNIKKRPLCHYDKKTEMSVSTEIKSPKITSRIYLCPPEVTRRHNSCTFHCFLGHHLVNMGELRNKGSGHARVGITTGPTQRKGTARLVRHARCWGGGVGVPTYYRPLNSVFRDVTPHNLLFFLLSFSVFSSFNFLHFIQRFAFNVLL